MNETKANVVALHEENNGALLQATLTYLAYLGAEIDADTLLLGLPVVSESLPESLLERAVEHVGYKIRWERARKLSGLKYPCCAGLKSGDFVAIVGMVEEGYQVLSDDKLGSVRLVPREALEAQFAGRAFYLRPKIELLQSLHSVPIETGHWFWSRIFFRKTRVLDIILASFFANLIAVVVSLFALQVYDRVIPGQSEATLWVLVGGAAIAILFESFIRVARSRLIDETGKESELQITQELFTRFLGMRMEKRPAPPGALVHMVREFTGVREFFTTASIGAAADLPFVFVFLVLIYGIAGPIVWIIVVGAVLTILPSLAMQKKMARLSQETLGGMSSASRLLTEAAYGLETVKLTQAAPRFQKNWEEITILNATKTTEQRELSAFLVFWSAAMQQCTYVAAVVGGVYMVFAGEFSVGSIIAVSILSTRTLSPITQLSSVLAKWQNMKASLDALDKVMSAEQERDPTKSYLRRVRMKGQIELKKAKFLHQGIEKASLQIESWKIPAGTKLGILGENGSGKSTLLRLLSGLYYPTEGTLTVDGLDIHQIDPVDVRSNIGLLPQEIQLYRGTIRDNLVPNVHKFSDEMLFAALDFGGIGEFVRRDERGLDFEIVDGGGGLSMGQRQSLGIARLYLQDPTIVLLDEPTAALDQKLEQEIVTKFGEWLGERTCIVATHRMPILSIVDKLVVMKAGEIVLEGPRDAVLERLSGSTKE